MNNTTLSQAKDSTIGKYGPWTASNIHLGGDLYTISKQITGDEIKVRRVLQIVSDVISRPLNSLRIVDLACHEGIYSIEFAQHGASVLGIEGREAHVAKAKFSQEALSLNNLTITQDDVRNFSKNTYGSFDVVLCLGILYHLDVPDVFTFIEQIAEACNGIAIIDTRIAFGPTTEYTYKGVTYFGHSVSEGHSPEDSQERKAKRYWASLDNLRSFCFSRTSLFCMLGRAGFTSVYECYLPPEPTKPIDRITLVAIKGTAQEVISSPLMGTYPVHNDPKDFSSYKIEKLFGVAFKAARMLPERLRIILASRGFLGRLFRPFQAAIKDTSTK